MRELILLSPYRLPAKDSLMLSDEDVSAFLNGYLALWHPLAALGAVEPPKIASPYDYENPSAGHVYAIPASPPMFLPDDWDQRVLAAGAVAFRAGSDRNATLANLKEALNTLSAAPSPPAPVAHGAPAAAGAPQATGDGGAGRKTDPESRVPWRTSSTSGRGRTMCRWLMPVPLYIVGSQVACSAVLQHRDLAINRPST